MVGAAGNMHLAGRNAGGCAAVQIALQEADRLLLRRVVAERDMDVAVDQSWAGGRAIGVDHQVALLELIFPDRSNFREHTVVHQDRVTVGEWIAPVSSYDGPDIHN